MTEISCSQLSSFYMTSNTNVARSLLCPTLRPRFASALEGGSSAYRDLSQLRHETWQSLSEDAQHAILIELCVQRAEKQKIIRPRHHAHWLYTACHRMGISMLPWWEIPLLGYLGKPPDILFYRGEPLQSDRSVVAMVGARRADSSALAWTQEVSSVLSRNAIIISGGAIGIDATAHLSTLLAGGTTWVVLGTAVDHYYPKQNIPLFRQILKQGGTLISEYGPGEKTPPWTHAQRNRIIAGFSQALVVAEAGEKSGSMGTIRYARRLGVPVWVSPPWIKGERGGLYHAFCRYGAEYLTSLPKFKGSQLS